MIFNLTGYITPYFSCLLIGIFITVCMSEIGVSIDNTYFLSRWRSSVDSTRGIHVIKWFRKSRTLFIGLLILTKKDSVPTLEGSGSTRTFMSNPLTVSDPSGQILILYYNDDWREKHKLGLPSTCVLFTANILSFLFLSLVLSFWEVWIQEKYPRVMTNERY